MCLCNNIKHNDNNIPFCYSKRKLESDFIKKKKKTRSQEQTISHLRKNKCILVRWWLSRETIGLLDLRHNHGIFFIYNIIPICTTMHCKKLKWDIYLFYSLEIQIPYWDICYNFITKVKPLGINIDSKLNFSAHVKTLCKSASSKVKALFRIRPYLDVKLSQTFILSITNLDVRLQIKQSLNKQCTYSGITCCSL